MNEALFRYSKPYLLRLELSHSTTITTEIGHCDRTEARGQVRARPLTLLLPWQGIEYTICRSQSELLTAMLCAFINTDSFGTTLLKIRGQPFSIFVLHFENS